jgi:8-oxo-dGTP pyrophosphatase MutT (NUDIX family)
MTLPRVRKVLSYVVRDGRLLVFRHRDYPDAGVQVPAGTLRDGEDPEAGAIRETEEETGRRGFRIVAKLGVYDHEFRESFQGVDRHELHERHVFHLEPPRGLPDTWSHRAEDEEGDFWFEFTWVALEPGLALAGDQHALVGRLDPR